LLGGAKVHGQDNDMGTLQPIYTTENCRFAGPLRWGLTVFSRVPINDAVWCPDLTAALEADGIHLLGHRFSEPGTSQFSLSTLPHITPLLVVKHVKGRLQYLLRRSHPRGLQRNYALRSFGPATREAVEKYVADQLGHHRMADPRVQELLARFQIHHPDVDLSKHRSTSHGIYWYNLHVVVVHHERWVEVDERILQVVVDMIERVCRSEGFLLSRGGILPDHLHLALGCPIGMAPADVALAILNNLAYVHGMKAVLQFGAFIGTFGEYHQGAVRGDSDIGEAPN
jgi:REP element-mobilizing transposase RayT